MNKEKKNKLVSALAWAHMILGLFILFVVGYAEGILTFIYMILYDMWVREK